jgi:SAM-dependent methyltransferase
MAGAELVVGVDRNEEALAYAGEHYASDRVLFERCDVQRLPYRRRFDLAVSFETVEHVHDHRALLRGLYDAPRAGRHAAPLDAESERDLTGAIAAQRAPRARVRCARSRANYAPSVFALSPWRGSGGSPGCLAPIHSVCTPG